MSSRIVGAALVAMAAAGASVGVGAGVAGGGEVVYGGTMVANPTTVEPGEIITVTNADGSECPLDEVTGQFTARPGQWVAQLDTDTGDWSVELEVPPNGPPDAMGNPTPFPPGTYDIFAWCENSSSAGVESAEARSAAAPAQIDGFQYDPITIEVVAAQEGPPTSGGGSPTSTPQTPGDTTPTTAGGGVQNSGAAAPVRAQPTFTG